MELLLEKFREKCRAAHAHTSFDPNKRGDQMVSDYSELLANDLEAVKQSNGDAQRYQEKFESLFSAWVSAKSNCFSVMITGASGFNNARHKKANDREDGSYKEFSTWREKALSKIKSNFRKETAGDPLEEAKSKLEFEQKKFDLMKAFNKVIRLKLSPEQKIEKLIEAGFSKENAEKAMQEDAHGFNSLFLANARNRVKSAQERVAILESKQALAEELPKQEIVSESGVKLVQNAEIDRVQLFFNGKPDPETITRLKKNGFKWSPSQGCWQRQMTENGIRAAKQFV